MKMHSGTLGRLASLKLLAQRFAFLSLILVSLGLMLLGKADNALVEQIRLRVGDVVAPVVEVVFRPATAIANLVNSFRELSSLRADNARLREENSRLMHWQTVARHLDVENQALHSQLNFIPEPDPSFITSRIIGDTGGAFLQSMLINAGSRDGVRKGQAVIAGEVMVGRIAEVGQGSARVLLLNDINSHLPVMIEGSRFKAILTGDNSDHPRLSYLSPNANAAPGDRVVTSGNGGVFPPGLPIGVVSSVQDGVARVEPFVHRYQLEYVTVVDYGLAGMLPSDNPSPQDVRDPGREQDREQDTEH